MLQLRVFALASVALMGPLLSAQKINGKSTKFAYIWVGNSETQCLQIFPVFKTQKIMNPANNK
jgi:hypothetical protein